MTSPLQDRPRLLFFRWAKPGLPAFLKGHLDEHVQILQHFFEVKVIDRDCDYAAECDSFQPALSIFESGVYAGERNIRNTGSRPDIPKLGFLHSDAYDLARAVFLSDMDRWGVEEFFTTSVAMAEYTPEIADRLFVWPNAVDPAIFRRYPVEKNIPVLFTGSQERHYPWRNAVGRVLSRSFATMTMPHYGWGKGGGRTVYGEQYARLLSASVFVPACGSMSRDLVRKHLEIPAAGACLVAEDTPALAAFGFMDMENCVLGEAAGIPDKLDALLADPERLEAVVAAGHDLVHSRHTQAHRSQIREWLDLQEKRGPGEHIVQAGPAGNLFLAPAGQGPDPFRAGGRDRGLLATGWHLLECRDVEGARQEFLKCLNFYFIPEAVLGLAFCELSAGNAQAARDWTTQALVDTFTDRSAPDPDPVLWATHIRALLCGGERDQAAAAASRFPDLRHRELDRIRRSLELGTAEGPARASICPVPFRSDEDWLRELNHHLQACGQLPSAARTSAGASAAAPGDGRQLAAHVRHDVRRARERASRRLRWRLRTGAAKQIRLRLSPLKQKLLTDDFSRTITDVVRREGLDQAVLYGEPGRDRGLRALHRGLSLNPSLPRLTMIPGSGGEPPATREARVVAYVADPAAAAGAAEYLSGCTLVILRGTTTAAGYQLLGELSAGSDLVLLAHDPLRGHVLLGRTGRRSAATRQPGGRPVPQAERTPS
ncbi:MULTISPECIES: glycosyltransferase [Arthrobacter]|uniref:glycosyltransferase family protein n=1 Tax=Arthrobacter TaxID=1663 RepID=UPI001D135806|nr:MULTISPECIES: glycosyltransferase [Arthrobacter]MCC3282356.1 glycosyltransferase [Arthrobacter caoxuetaonis]MCC9194145.1 glycosyltransferase [Arthrobacter sp. zg-Y916]